MHIDPRTVEELIASSGRSAEDVAADADLLPERLDELLAGDVQLGSDAAKRLAGVFDVDWWELRCESRRARERCPACRAGRRVPREQLGTVVEPVRGFLSAAAATAASWDAARRASHPRSVAQDLSSLPQFDAAARAARRVGGRLDPESLAVTGIAGLVAAGDFDVDRCAEELARYAVRGEVRRVRHVGLDVTGLPDGPVQVAGWELVRYSRDELDRLAPVPCAAGYQQAGWFVESAERTWWLRRNEGTAVPSDGRVIWFPGNRYEQASAPLLVLQLAHDAIADPICEFVVEPGNAVMKISGHELDLAEHQDGYLEVLEYGEYDRRGVDEDDWPAWQRFVEGLGGVVGTLYGRSGRPAQRFVRAAGHFLKATEDSARNWEPQQQALFDYSTAMEVLLLGGGNTGETTFRLRNAAAWVGGVDDADREDLFEFAGRVYSAGSKYRHGGRLADLYDGERLRETDTQQFERMSASSRAVDMRRARRLVRRLLTHAAAVVAAGEDVAALAERAQRGDDARDTIRRLVDDFYASVGLSPQRFSEAL